MCDLELVGVQSFIGRLCGFSIDGRGVPSAKSLEIVAVYEELIDLYRHGSEKSKRLMISPAAFVCGEAIGGLGVELGAFGGREYPRGLPNNEVS